MAIGAAVSLHLLAVVIWVGGMFFAYMALRPVAAALLDAPTRLALWHKTFARFFPWVWVAVVTLPATGYWMLFARFGSMATAPLYVHIMHGLGWLMIALFMHVFFAPYRRLGQALANNDFAAGGSKLAQIRKIVGINLLLGLSIVVVVSLGRFWM